MGKVSLAEKARILEKYKYRNQFETDLSMSHNDMEKKVKDEPEMCVIRAMHQHTDQN